MVIEVPLHDVVVVLVDLEDTGVDHMIPVSMTLGVMVPHLHLQWANSIMVLLVMITTTENLLWCPTPPRILLCRPEVAEAQNENENEADREATDEEVRFNVSL